MTVDAARQILKKYKYEPGKSKTKGRPPAERDEIKAACRTLKLAALAGDAPKEA